MGKTENLDNHFPEKTLYLPPTRQSLKFYKLNDVPKVVVGCFNDLFTFVVNFDSELGNGMRLLWMQFWGIISSLSLFWWYYKYYFSVEKHGKKSISIGGFIGDTLEGLRAILFHNEFMSSYNEQPAASSRLKSSVRTNTHLQWAVPFESCYSL